MLKNADINTLCLADGFRDSDYVNMIFELVPELKEHPRGELHSEKFPELKNVVFIGQQKHRGMYNTAELILCSLRTGIMAGCIRVIWLLKLRTDFIK